MENKIFLLPHESRDWEYGREEPGWCRQKWYPPQLDPAPPPPTTTSISEPTPAPLTSTTTIILVIEKIENRK